MRKERGLRLPIEIDGGVSLENIGDVVRAGVNWVVAGSTIFHSGDPEATVRQMYAAARDALAVRV
jgi:ribulose-phosphate 3-epimerase